MVGDEITPGQFWARQGRPATERTRPERMTPHARGATGAERMISSLKVAEPGHQTALGMDRPPQAREKVEGSRADGGRAGPSRQPGKDRQDGASATTDFTGR